MKETNILRQVSRAVKNLSNHRSLKKSLGEAFDKRWYVMSNPDVASSAIDPLKHYLSYGLRENRAPNAIFSPDWYLKTNPDVAVAKINPLIHYLKFGYREGRSPHPLFDGEWYLQEYPDVRSAGINPLIHFVKYGAVEQRRPSIWFDPEWYLSQTTDAYARENPIGHFLAVVAASKISPIPLFDSEWYIDQYPDIRDNGINPLMHYVLYGADEGRNPNMLFDTQWYLKQAGDEAKHNPLLHYISLGAAAGLSPHSMFDGTWYSQRYSDVAGAKLEPLYHYYRTGRQQGRSPHPTFDAFWYISQPHTHGIALSDAFRHYLTIGLLRGYPGNSPSTLGSTAQINNTERNNFSPAKPTILMVVGRSNQEIDLHIHHLSKNLAPDTNGLIMKCSGDGDQVVEFHVSSTRSPVRFNVIYENDKLVEFLSIFNLKRASVHCSDSEFVAFKNLNQTLKLPYDITLYDYGLFGSEQYPSLDDNKVNKTEGFDSEAIPAPNNFARGMIEDAKKVFVPSNDMIARIQPILSLKSFEIAPLLCGLPQKQINVSRLKPGQYLNVAVLWNENDPSQFQTITEVSRLADRSEIPIRILLAGSRKSSSLASNPSSIIELGEYARGQLSEILKQNQVHLVWYPSKILESFSLTLSEGLSTGLPVLVPNLGAYPERVADRPWSFVANCRSTPAEWLEWLETLRDCILTHPLTNVTRQRSGV